jgi:hypothetical protein
MPDGSNFPPLRVAALFSCGEPSACAVKVRLAELRRSGSPYELAIIRCVVADEHPDNDRFAAECQEWFGQEIINLSSDEYADCFDVWEKRRYMNGHKGAPCTLYQKKIPRQDWERIWQPDQHVFGYTQEEARRAGEFASHNPEINLDCPLIRAGLSAADCAGMIHAAGIARPIMYQLGFKHNNCRGCVKARSPRYWALVRRHFPARFYRLAALCRDIGWTPCRASDDTPIWLDELPLDTPCEDDSADIECSLFCHVEMQKIRESEPGAILT